ncbi:MAG: hypothetical protein C0490_12135 [Marivirga sp.]|nr:hypothetical protein [Marivirga sp.]
MVGPKPSAALRNFLQFKIRACGIRTTARKFHGSENVEGGYKHQIYWMYSVCNLVRLLLTPAKRLKLYLIL